MWRAIRELAQDRNLDGNLVDTENNYEAIQMEIFWMEKTLKVRLTKK